MTQRVIRIIAIVVIFICCFVMGFCSGFIVERFPDLVTKIQSYRDYTGTAEFLTKVATPYAETEVDQNGLFKPFWEAWNLVLTYYVDQPLDANSLMEGAIRGMLESLGDPHTRYSDPESYQKEVEYMSGEEYEGIGAWVDVTGEFVEISSPMIGSPAEKAGLKPHDLVIAINGEDMTGIDPSDALQKILGPKGTTVTLTIRREGVDPFDVTIAREAIVTPMVISKMLEENIAYVQLTQFGDLTVEELRQALDDLIPKNPKGLILDLRNNGGGFVNTCVDVASEFLPEKKKVLTEKDGDGKETDYMTQSYGGRALDIPMVVLGNEGTASASEILIGALQYYERAVFIGVKTYGKGSMQIQPKLSNGGAVSVTIAKWYTPGGELIDGVGIEPDIPVEITDADIENGIDTQLDQAIEYLLKNDKTEIL